MVQPKDGSTEDLTAWVAYLDVYGFSAMVENGLSATLHKTLVRLHNKARRLITNKHPEAKYLFVSDSTLILYPVKTNDEHLNILYECVDDVSEILTLFLDRSLPLRGAITFGTISFGKQLLVGPPVVRAVQLEQSLPYPLVFVPARDLHYPVETNPNPIVEADLYVCEVEIGQAGVARGCLVFPSDLTGFYQYAQRQFMHHSTFGLPRVALAWKSVGQRVKERLETLNQRT